MTPETRRYLERIQALESENSALSADNRDLQLRQTALLTELALCKEAQERVILEKQAQVLDQAAEDADDTVTRGWLHERARCLRHQIPQYPLNQED